MQIQIQTDNNIEGHEAFSTQVRGVVEESLSQFSDLITQVDVYLSDQNGDRNSAQQNGNENMRCLIEARLEGHQPIAVTDQAASLDQAVDGAAEKLTHLIDHRLGRRSHQASHRNDPPLS